MLALALGSTTSANPSLDEVVSYGALKPIQPTEWLANVTLESHPHFRGRSQWIQTRYQDRCLYLSGKLPSFFLKQLAQEALRQLDGVDRIENQIVVVSPQGQFDPSGNAVLKKAKAAKVANHSLHDSANLRRR